MEEFVLSENAIFNKNRETFLVVAGADGFEQVGFGTVWTEETAPDTPL